LALNANDNSSQRDSNLAMTQHHRAHEPVATKALPPVVASLMQPFREFFTAPVNGGVKSGHWGGAKVGHLGMS
jgi:hypothetical protein